MIPCCLPIPGRHAAFVLLAAMTMANGGCLAAAGVAAAGAAGAGGYAYMKGKVSYTFNSSVEDTWSAARKSLAEMQMPILEEERQNTQSGFFRSETTDGTAVRIYLEAVEDEGPPPTRGTEVTVRVGTFGDYTVSDHILRQLSAHLIPITPGAAGNPVAGGSWSAVNPGADPRIQPQAIPPIRIEPPLPPDSAQPAARIAPTAAPPPPPVAPPPPLAGSLPAATTAPPPLLPPQPVRP